MLDINKLSKVKHRGNNITAQCPACAEAGRDQKGQHLFVTPKGEYACVLYPGESGHSHRQRIHALVGIKEKGFTKNDKAAAPKKTGALMKIKPADKPKPEVIQKNILGHLGRINETHARKEEVNTINPSLQSNTVNPVPSVPETSEKYFSEMLGLYFVIKNKSFHFDDGVIYSPEELKEMEKLKGIDEESLKKTHELKKIFNGKVVKVVDSLD